MDITTVLLIVVIALVWMYLHFTGRVMILEYKVLLLTETVAELEGSKESKVVAKQARDEINKRFWLIDKMADKAIEQ